MQLLLEPADFAYRLRGADGRRALVNERALTASFILAPDTLIEPWRPAALADLQPRDLDPLLALAPQVILLGVGDTQAFPSSAVLAACLQRGIGLEAMTSAAAARTFNVLAGEGRRVVAGFLLGG